MAIKNRLFRIFPLAFMSLSAIGCGPDLGIYEEENLDDYYDSFGDVKAIYEDDTLTYDIEDSLFNETTMNDFTWEDDDDRVQQQPYVYLVIPFEVELKIEAIVLFFYTDVNIDMEVSGFYFTNESYAPQNIKFLHSPDTEGEGEEEKEIEYDDPPREESIANGTLSLYKDEWTSFALGNFNQYGYHDNYLHTGQDGLLYIRIENNSGFNRDTMTSFSFSFINLLVRAVEQ